MSGFKTKLQFTGKEAIVIFLKYNMIKILTKIELKAMPRKLALFVTLTLQPLGMGIIVLVHRFSDGKPCTRTAENSRPI